MTTIVIVSGIPLSCNPRVVKEATVLTAAGYDVEILAAMFDERLGPHDDHLIRRHGLQVTYVYDGRRAGARQKVQWAYARIRHRAGAGVWKATKIANSLQLGYFVPELLRECLARNADLYSVHLETGLWVGRELARRGYRVGVDFEDWYSEDLLEDARAGRPIQFLKQLEMELLQRATYCWTTSQCMADTMARVYGVRPPNVVYNSFPPNDREKVQVDSDHAPVNIPLSICWYSQTVGPGRGLEDLMQCTRMLGVPVEIHLRGDCTSEYKRFLVSMASSVRGTKVHFFERCAHHELKKWISRQDVGFAGETGHCASRDLTITNKVFEYLQAGIPVLATTTSGQVEAMQKAPGAFFGYRAGQLSDLAKAIEQCADRVALPKAKAAAERALSGPLSWQRSANQICNSVERSLAHPAMPPIGVERRRFNFSGPKPHFERSQL